MTLWSFGSCQCRLIILGAVAAGRIGGGAFAVGASLASMAGATYTTCKRSPFVKVSEAAAVPTEEAPALAETNAAALANEAGCCGFRTNLNEASAPMPSNRTRPSQTVRII